MTRRLLYIVALLILVGGLALALFVVTVRTCRMDEFDCFGSRNFPKALVAVAAARTDRTVASLLRAALREWLAAHEEGEAPAP